MLFIMTYEHIVRILCVLHRDVIRGTIEKAIILRVNEKLKMSVFLHSSIA